MTILALAGGLWGPHLSRSAELTAVRGVEVFVTAGKAVYAPGDPIALTLRVVNGGGRPATLTFRDAQRFDFIVRDREGREAWRWAAGRVFAQVIGTEAIPPSGSLVYTVRVEKGLTPGEYVATGLVTAQEGSLSASAVVRVEPR